MADKEMSSGKKLVIGLVILVVAVFFGYEGVHFTSSPWFCRNACHSMEWEAVQWEKSNHKKHGVECIHCHVAPGLGGLIEAKLAAFPQMIHELTEQVGERYEVEEEHEYVPQYIHNPKKDLGKHISNYADEKGNYIIRVHPGSRAYEILTQNCRDCHSSKGNRGIQSKYRIADFVVKNYLISFRGRKERRRKGVPIPHAIHLDQGHSCLGCHSEVVHGPDEYRDENNSILPRMELCFRCHGTKNEEGKEIAPRRCPMCHQKQKEMNYGTGGVGIEDEPSFMVEAEVVCTDCHREENDYQVGPRVCEDCHEEGQYSHKEKWQHEMDELLVEFKKVLDEIEPRLPVDKENVTGDVRAVIEMYTLAKENYDFIVMDGTKSVHNPVYARKLVEFSMEKLGGVKRVLGISG